MKINPMVLEVLKQYNINKDEGLLVLLGIHFGLSVDSVLPEEVVTAVNLTKIVDRDYALRTVNWNIPLFQDSNLPNNWNWVMEWVEGFGRVNPDRKGSWRDAISRMQKFFKMYPEYRVEDVFKARDLYFKNLRDRQYLMKSHKFIFDGVGAMEKSTLLEYCEKVVKPTIEHSDIRGKIVE